MKYLLDTHVLIWWLENQQKLSTTARKIIGIHNHEIMVSSASLWEMAIKSGLGKLRTPPDAIERIRDENFTLIDIKPIHAMKVLELPSIHQDPFDRMLIAQALVEGATLVTRDKRIVKYPVDCIMA
jgi:PIN domain nuclease of toxin-antitoxin system